MSGATAGAAGGLPISPQELLAIARRRWWVFLLPALVIAGLGSILVMRLPAAYLATGTILIEGQQIPEDLVRTTVGGSADERITVVRRLVMNRENLLAIVDKFQLFPEVRDSLTDSQKLDRIRSGITIEKLKNPGSRSSNNVTFQVSYESSSAQTAYDVTRELVDLFLSENIRTRTERASETTEFLTREAGTLQVQLEGIEAKIAAYKRANADALPEHLKLHMDMLDRTQAAFREIKLDIKSAQDELRFLEVERAAVTSGLSGDDEVVLTPEQELSRAEVELTRLRSRFSDKHPDVRRQQALVDNLQESVTAAGGGAGPGVESGNLDVARVDAQIASVRERITSLEAQARELETRQAELEEVVLRTPEVQSGLAALTREFENTDKKFKEVTAKALEARMAQSLEEGENAERFLLVDPPVIPDFPYKPARKKLLLMVFVAACAVGGGLAFVVEMLDRKIRTPATLEKLTGMQPLIVIPYLPDVGDASASVRYHRLSLLATGGMAVLLLMAMHFLFMPMGTVLGKLLSLLG